MAKPHYVDPPSAEWAKKATSKGYDASESHITQGTLPEKSDNGFVGVAPEYQNYANDTEAPLPADNGPEAKLEKLAVTDDVDYTKAATPEGESEAEEEESDQSPASTLTSSTITPPPAPPTGGSTPPPPPATPQP